MEVFRSKKRVKNLSGENWLLLFLVAKNQRVEVSKDELGLDKVRLGIRLYSVVIESFRRARSEATNL